MYFILFQITSRGDVYHTYNVRPLSYFEATKPQNAVINKPTNPQYFDLQTSVPLPGSVFDFQYEPITKKEQKAVFRQSKFFDPKKSFYQTDFKPISKLSTLQDQRKRKKKIKKPNIDFINKNQETSLVYINPINPNEKRSFKSISNQPVIDSEANIDWSSDIQANPIIKNPIQVIDRGKEIPFKDELLFSDTNKIR